MTLPHLVLQLLSNLLDPPQRLLRLQLLQAEQGQAELVLLGGAVDKGEGSGRGRETAAAPTHMPCRGSRSPE